MADRALSTIRLFSLIAVPVLAFTVTTLQAADKLSGWKNHANFAQFQSGGVVASASGSKLSFEGTGATGRYTFADNQKEYSILEDIKITFDLNLKAPPLTPDPAVNETTAGVSVFLAKRAELGHLVMKDGVELAFYQQSPSSSRREMRVLEYQNGAPKIISTTSISSGKPSVEILYESSKDKVTVTVGGDVLGTYRGLESLRGNNWISPWFQGWQTGANTWKKIFIKNVTIKSSATRPLGGDATTKNAVVRKTGKEKVVWFGNSSAFIEANNSPFDKMAVGGPKYSDGYRNSLKRQGLVKFYDYDGQQLFTIAGGDIADVAPEFILNGNPFLSSFDTVRACEFGWSVANSKGFGSTAVQPALPPNEGLVAIGAPGWRKKQGAVLIFTQSGDPVCCILAPNNPGRARFGWSVHSPGDVNNDGFIDLVVGAPTEDNANGENAGAVYVLSGNIPNPPAQGNPPDIVEPVVLFRKTGNSPGAMMGYSVSSCDAIVPFGQPNVVVGAPFETVGNKPNVGAVYVFDGSGNQLQKYQGDDSGDSFGYSVANAGDFNFDGKGDIIVGAPTMNNAKGAAYVFSVANNDRLFKITGSQKDAQMGWAVSGGIDIEGDGFSDIAVSSPGITDTIASQGLVSVYLGQSGFLLSNVYGRFKNDQMGSSVGMTDKTPFGPSALLTGSYRHLQNNKRGAVYLNVLNN